MLITSVFFYYVQCELISSLTQLGATYDFLEFSQKISICSLHTKATMRVSMRVEYAWAYLLSRSCGRVYINFFSSLFSLNILRDYTIPGIFAEVNPLRLHVRIA